MEVEPLPAIGFIGVISYAAWHQYRMWIEVKEACDKKRRRREWLYKSANDED